MARGQDTGNHPNRQVGLPEGQRLSWPEVKARQDARSAAYRAARDAGTGGIKSTRPAGSHAEHTQHTQATEWTSRMQLAEDMKWDRQRGD